MFAFTDRRGGVEVAFTDAEQDLSLDRDVEGQGRAVAAVTRALNPDHPPRYAAMRQVHGRAVVEVGTGTSADSMKGKGVTPPVCDALVTTRTGVALAARAADCVPVLLADPGAGVIAAIHAGRDGVRLDVVGAGLEEVLDRGATEIVAWVGPRVCGSCYEVPSRLRDEVSAVVPATWATTSWGTPSLDLTAGVRAQLAARPQVVEVVEVDLCTREDPDLHSYRRDGAVAGRHAGLIWMRP